MCSSDLGKIGFLPLGDGITGAGEENIELNYFMISGDVIFPATFTKLVQFPISVNDEGVHDMISIWHPEPVVISDKGKPTTYYPLGDLCNYSSDTPPTTNSIALVSETCLQPVEDDNMELMFLYSGVARITTQTRKFVLGDEDSTSSDGMFNITSNTVDVATVFSM